MTKHTQTFNELVTAVMTRRKRGAVRYWLDGTAVHFVIDGVTHCGRELGGQTEARPIRAQYCEVCADVSTAVTEREKVLRERERERERNLSIKHKWLK